MRTGVQDAIFPAQPRSKKYVLNFDVVTHFTRWRLLLSLLVATAVPGLQVAAAQQCSDFVAVNGAMLGDGAATACYFGAAEGVGNAYVRTDLVTAALGLESSYLPDTGQLRFVKGDRSALLLATDDVDAALSKRPDALTVGGEAEAGRSAILAGSSYLPLAEIVTAFGGSVSWNGPARLALVDFSGPPEAAAAPAVTAEPTPPTPPEPTITQTLTELADPRYAAHEGGYTRVAVDIPVGVTYQLAVDGDNFIVLFEGAKAEPYEVTPNGAQLVSLGYRTVGGSTAQGGMLALIAGTSYPLTSTTGFQTGVIGRDDGSQTFYVNFAPGLQGEKVAELADLSKRQLAAVQRPQSVQKTVVIDPGHGGKDPGTMSGYVMEKDVVLSVGLLLRDKLEARGISVEMTRDDDTFVSLEDRAAFAVPSKDNLFVSLHANATGRGDAEGIETWVFGEQQDDSLIDLAVLENGGGEVGRTRTARAQETAVSIDGDLLREENLTYSTVLAKNVQQDLLNATGSTDRGVKKNYFVVIRNARVPAVLVELGFVDSPDEGPKLAEASYQDTLAEALADGIETFLARGGALAALGSPKD